MKNFKNKKNSTLLTISKCIFVLSLVAIFLTNASISIAAAPTVDINDAKVTTTGVTLSGTVNPNGDDTFYYFAYGLPGQSQIDTDETGIGSGAKPVPAVANIDASGLSGTYDFYLIAKNSENTTSPVGHFTIGAAATPPPSNQGTNTQGTPPGTQGTPPNTQGTPPGTQGTPPNTQGTPPLGVKINTGITNPLGDNVKDIPTFIKTILDIVLLIGVPIITLAIIYSGFLFVTARGNEEKLKSAKATLLSTIIGAALLLGSFVIANAIQGTVNDIKTNNQ